MTSRFRLNQRGVFLTLMVFIVGIVVVGLAISHASAQKERESLLPESTARERVNEQFNEAYYALSDLLQNQSIAKDRARVLPFKYNADTNMVWLRQTMPIENEKFDEFNDYLNLYELFWKKQSDLNTSFSFEAVKNQLWLPGKPRYPAYEFKILPQCVLYRLDQLDNNYGKRILVIKKGNPSENNCEFDRQMVLNQQDPQQPTSTPDSLRNSYEIQKIIVNIHSDRNYSKMPSCATAGNEFYYVGTECWRKPFDANRGWPYGEVNFMVGNDLNASVYNHYNPDPRVAAQQIDFNLAGQLPGKDQNITFGGNEILRIDMSGINPAAVVTVDVNIFFRRPIEAFLLENLSISVENIPFRIRRLSLDQNQLGYCGDGNCAAPGENIANCPQDCACGNGICEAQENTQTCANDCPVQDKLCSDSSQSDAACGCYDDGRGQVNRSKDSSCDYANVGNSPDTFANCKDCTWTCGNGRCDTGETNIPSQDGYCPQDCPRNCVDQCPQQGWLCDTPNSRWQCGYNPGPCLTWMGMPEFCQYGCLNGRCKSKPSGGGGGTG